MTYLAKRVGFAPNRNEPQGRGVMPEDHANRHPLALRVVADRVGFEPDRTF